MIRETAEAGLCVALLTVCSWISFSYPVPFTMQTFAVIFITGILGIRGGCVVLSVYLALGAVGLPVFSAFRSGFSALAGPTGGYLLGFYLLVLAFGIFCEIFGRKWPSMLAGGAVGMILCYAFGTLWYMTVYGSAQAESLFGVLGMCVFPFLLPDAAKTILAVFLIRKLYPILRKDRNGKQ
ncbi:MAG: biotin transporter BioY [Clostridia bacterium]|nr:biotin transporter BioY [Clostridia bacterium]